MSDTVERQAAFAVCIHNAGYPASLELRKLYAVINDPTAEARGFIRVVDESGEDYLYPQRLFIRIPLPEAVREAVLLAS